MKPLQAEQVQSTCQVLLAFLDSDGANVPGNMLEGVVSGKSLLRGILSGNLVVCQTGEPNLPPGVEPPEGDEDPDAKKKTPRKKAPRKKTPRKKAA